MGTQPAEGTSRSWWPWPSITRKAEPSLEFTGSSGTSGKQRREPMESGAAAVGANGERAAAVGANGERAAAALSAAAQF